MGKTIRLFALLAVGLGPAALIAACAGEDATLTAPGADAASEQGPLAEGSAADTATADTSTADTSTADGGGCNKTAPFSTFTNITELNTDADEQGFTLSADELNAVVITYTQGAGMYGATAWSRTTLSDPFVLVPIQVINEIDALYSVALSSDGKSLFYSHGGAGELIRRDRASPALPFGSKMTVTGPSGGGGGRRDAFYSAALSGSLFVSVDVASVTSIHQWTGATFTTDLPVLEDPDATVPGGVRNAVVSADGTKLFYASLAGGVSSVHSTSRVALSAPFPLGPVVTELASDLNATPHFYSADECRLYFTSQARVGGRAQSKDIWVATRSK